MGWVVNATPLPLYPWGKSQYPLYRRLDRPQGRSGRVWKISSPPEFDHRTVQSVASRYTDWASVENILWTWAEVSRWRNVGCLQNDDIKKDVICTKIKVARSEMMKLRVAWSRICWFTNLQPLEDLLLEVFWEQTCGADHYWAVLSTPNVQVYSNR